MLGIWHRCEWMNRDLAQPFYGRVECGSPISGWFIAFINEKFIPLISMCKCIDVYVDLDESFVSLLLLCCLYVYFITTTMYGSRHVFTCK